MILISVLVGYALGIAPFVVPETIKLIQGRTKKIDIEKQKEQDEIIDEWLNGAKADRVNQADIYKEYITGNETVGKE